MRLPCSHCRGLGSAPARGTKMPEAARHNQNYRNRHGEQQEGRHSTPGADPETGNGRSPNS